MPKRSPRPPRRGLVAVLVALLVVCLGCAGVVWGLSQLDGAPVPLAEKCVATVDGDDITLTPDQARWASLIASTAETVGMGERGAVIGLAAAWQESTLRNLDHGDRDSLGLFQQRPSQGWGTPEEVMDPHYATRTFYTAIDNRGDWQTGDVNDIIQRVQLSGHPQAYRKHVDRSTRLAAVLTGRQQGVFTCLNREIAKPDAGALQAEIQRTTGLQLKRDGSTLRVSAPTPERAWAIAYQAVANTANTGVTSVRVGGSQWRPSATAPAAWSTTSGPSEPGTDVVIAVG